MPPHAPCTHAPVAPATSESTVRPTAGTGPGVEPGLVLWPGRRHTVDVRELVGLPLAPLGKAVRPHPRGAGDERELAFHALGWRVVWPQAPRGGRRPTSIVTDVYLALMRPFKDARFPTTGRVEFSPYRLLEEIGRISRSGRPAYPPARPSGSAYQDLRAALDHLSRVVYERTPAAAASPGEVAGAMRLEPFSVLSGYAFGDDGADGRAHVVFSPAVVRLARGGRGVVPLDWVTYLSLPGGAPRALYRWLASVWPDREVTVGATELLQRLGSTQERANGARVRQRLDRAHAALVERGVLVRIPDIAKCEGEWWVRYSLARMSSGWLREHDADLAEFNSGRAAWRGLDDEMELLVTQAVGYGMHEHVAVELATEHPRAFMRTLAAAALGILVPWRTLPGMIVDYTRKGHPIVDRGQRIETRRPGTGPGADGELYQRWSARERRARVAQRRRAGRPIDVDAVRRQCREVAVRAGLGEEDWVADGLAEIVLQQVLEIPPYTSAAWREAACVAEPR